MKATLLLLISIIFLQTATAGLPPTTARGQGQSAKTGTFNFEVPNNQTTKTATGTLFENGNKNILVNPSFEHSTATTGWVIGGSPVEETSVVIDGNKSLKFTPSAATFSIQQNATRYNQEFADGVQGLAMVMVKTSLTTIQVCSTQNAVASTTNCVKHTGSGKWERLKVPMILGNYSNGFIIQTTAASTGTVYVDDAFVGAVDLKTDAPKITTHTQSRRFTRDISGPTAIAGVLETTTEIGSGLLSYNSTTGVWTTLKRVKLDFTQYIRTKNAALANTYISVNGVVTSSAATPSTISAGTVASYNGIVEAGSTISTTVENGTSDQDRAYITATEVVNGSTYSSNNADFGWTPYTSTVTGLGSGSGTVTAKYKRQGDSALINIRFIKDGTAGAGSALVGFSLPSNLSVDASKSNDPGGTVTGQMWTSYSALSEKASNSYASPSSNLIHLTSGSSAIVGSQVVAGTNIDLFIAVPIVGWEQSNIVIGQFNGLESCKDSYECTDTYSAIVTWDGVKGVVGGENIDWIQGDAPVSDTSLFTITPKTGLTVEPMNCQATLLSGSTGANETIKTPTVANNQILVRTGYGTADTYYVKGPISFSILCQKRGQDYLGKTAKAVASDANVRSIGSVGVDVQSVYFGSGTDCSGACTTGTCNICSRVGTKITDVSYFTFGGYNINGIDGTKYNCTGNGHNGTTMLPGLHIRSASTSNFARYVTYSGATPTNSGYNSVTCTGIP